LGDGVRRRLRRLLGAGAVKAFSGGPAFEMTLTGLDLLFLEVNNLEESLAFYQGVLGLDLETRNPEAEPPMATLRAGSLKITLVQQLETMLLRGRGVHFFLGVDDVDLFYEAVSVKIPDIDSPVDEGWGGRFVTLQDPDKYRFFFVTWSPAVKPERRTFNTLAEQE
jgi:catechol 2,3-dioxygenase-like lactoylglutathione lyase family enzyme